MKIAPSNKFFNRVSVKFTLVVTFVLGFLIFTTQRVSAYDNDTHFWLTYYLAVKSGYSQIQATQIASANISVDFDPQTQPVLPSPNFKFDIFRPKTYVQNVRIYLHALPFRPGEIGSVDPRKTIDPEVLKLTDSLVLEKQNYRWAEVVKYKDNPGVFLHYLQDKHAHRGFFSIVGHAGYEYVDYLDSDCEKASEMVKDTVNYLIEFKKLRTSALSYNLSESVDNNWRQLDVETWSEINDTLHRFTEANPTPDNKIEDTDLLKSLRDKNDLFSLSNIKKFYKRWKTAKSPDSFKAREIVKEKLKLSENQMPKIWFYDLRQGGFPVADTKTYRTSKIKTYQEPNVRENLKTRKEKDKFGKVLCLPWEIVRDEVSKIERCSD